MSKFLGMVIATLFVVVGFGGLVLFNMNEKKIEKTEEFYYDSTGLVASKATDLFGEVHWFDENHNEGHVSNSLACAINENRICKKCGKYITGCYWETENLETFVNGKWMTISEKYTCDVCYK